MTFYQRLPTPIARVRRRNPRRWIPATIAAILSVFPEERRAV